MASQTFPNPVRSSSQVEIRDRDAFDLIEADAGQILGKDRRVADEHDRQFVGTQVLLGDSLDVLDADGVHPFAVGLQLIEIQTVEHGVQHLQRNRARGFNRQRKTPGQIFLGIRELALLHSLPLQTHDLLDDNSQRFSRLFRARVGFQPIEALW